MMKKFKEAPQQWSTLEQTCHLYWHVQWCIHAMEESSHCPKTWNTWKTFWTHKFTDHQEMHHMTINQYSILGFHATTAANATTSKNSLVDMQATTIKSHQLTLTDLTTTITKLKSNIESLTKKSATLKQINLSTFECNGYCWIHSYLLKKNHTSKTCNNCKDRHKGDATNINNMGRSKDNKGCDSWWFIPEGPNSTFKLNENLINELSDPDCINHLNLQNAVLIDLAASKTPLCHDAPSTLSNKPHIPIHLPQPDGSTLVTTQTCTLNLHNLPDMTKTAHTLPGIVNNLLVICKLTEAGHTILFT